MNKPIQGAAPHYYVDQITGEYLGGFAGCLDEAGVEIPPAAPPNAVEVPTPPPVHAGQRWDGAAWGPPPPATPGELRRVRIAELLAIPRSDWTVAQQRELIQLTAQSIPPYEGGTTGGL